MGDRRVKKCPRGCTPIIPVSKVVEHLQTTDGTGDEDFVASLVREVRRYPYWRLGYVPIAPLDFEIAHDVEDYEEFLAVPAVIIDTDVLDGRHRASAALALGRSHLLAYTPVTP